MTDAGCSGVLVVDKPTGATSFDMVARLRRRLGVRRIGHAGTLDPDAVGVLPLLIGEATKLVAYLLDESKEYVATVRFGVTTDSQDLSGRVLSTAPVPLLTPEGLAAATRPFVGRIRQVPPMFSAVHHDGRRLYELARAGVEVPREAREAIVHEIVVEDVGEATARLRIVCGRGTYIRTLAADLGTALGCGAAIERLVRTRVGPFDLPGATTAAEIATVAPDVLWARVLPPEAALGHWRVVRLDAPAAQAFVHGQRVGVPGPTATTAAPAALVRIHDERGRLLGVGEVSGDGRAVKPVRVLHADRSGPRVLSN
jgi:tRNA pseudouridine55 synthase